MISYFIDTRAEGVDPDKFKESWQSNTDIEIQVFELKIRNIRKMILINVYRPPAGSADNIIMYLTETLQGIPKLQEYEIFILGDMNLPYNQSNSPSYPKFKEFEAQFGLRQLLTTPTHFDLDVANTLDLIYTNSVHIKSSGTWEISLSDHKPTYVIRKKVRSKIKRVPFECRSFQRYVKEDFQMDLSDYNCGEFFLLEDPELAWQHIIKP